jgi:hypothetical protein
MRLPCSRVVVPSTYARSAGLVERCILFPMPPKHEVGSSATLLGAMAVAGLLVPGGGGTALALFPGLRIRKAMGRRWADSWIEEVACRGKLEVTEPKQVLGTFAPQ